MRIPISKAIQIAYAQLKLASASDITPAPPAPNREPGPREDRDSDFARRAAGAIMGAPQGMGLAFALGPALPDNLQSLSAPIGIPAGLALGGLAGYHFPGVLGTMAGFSTGAAMGGGLGHVLGRALDDDEDSSLPAALSGIGALAGGIPGGYLGYKLMHLKDQ